MLKPVLISARHNFDRKTAPGCELSSGPCDRHVVVPDVTSK